MFPGSFPAGPECLRPYSLVRAKTCVVGRIRSWGATVVHPALGYVAEARTEGHRIDVGTSARLYVLAKNVLVDDVTNFGCQTHDVEAFTQLVRPYLLATYDTWDALARFALCEFARKSEVPQPIFDQCPFLPVRVLVLVLLACQNVLQCQLGRAAAKCEPGCKWDFFERLLNGIQLANATNRVRSERNR
jgi:hypothetical protein